MNYVIYNKGIEKEEIRAEGGNLYFIKEDREGTLAVV